MPDRIQRRRTPGWRLPDNTVVVSRPTRLGNPWRIHRTGAIVNDYGGWRVDIRNSGDDPRQWAVDQYRYWLDTGDSGLFNNYAIADMRHRRQQVLDLLPTLTGRNLCCWCPLDLPCHADVLLELANPT